MTRRAAGHPLTRRTRVQPLGIVPNLIDQVYERLVDAIAAGELEPGARLGQEEVAARLGVSRQPVSHALHMLKRQGLAIEQGKRGVAVAPIEPRRIADLYEVRAALEEVAASRAARAVAEGLADPAAFFAARNTLATGQSLSGADPMHDWIAADVRFHSALHRLSGNMAIVETVAAQWPHFKRSMGAVLGDREIRRRVWAEHAGILAAVEAGDPDEAGRRARTHTEQAGAALVARLLLKDDAA
jgi:DNA-binding GntR family transcriptional regulator